MSRQISRSGLEDGNEQFVIKVADAAFKHPDSSGRTDLEELSDQSNTVGRLKRTVYFRRIFRDTPCIQKTPKPFF